MKGWLHWRLLGLRRVLAAPRHSQSHLKSAILSVASGKYVRSTPAMADEDAAEAPPPTWRAHLFSVFAPEGYNLAPLLQEIGGGSRPRIVVVDVAALSGGSADPEAVAKALATKVANDKVAAVDAKKAAIAAAAAAAAEAAAEAAAAEAAAKAAAEEAGVPYVPPASAPAPAAAPAAVEPPLDSPPPAEKAADAYYLLQNFPRSAAEAAALAKEGVVIDTFVAFEMDSECLRVCKGEPPPVPAEGETELPPPTLLEPTALQTELAALIGVEGSGLEQAVLLTLKGLAPDEWNTPAAVLSRLSALTCARLLASPPPSPPLPNLPPSFPARLWSSDRPSLPPSNPFARAAMRRHRSCACTKISI